MKENNQKILFICGSFCKGKDGVGDYTLAIANRLAEMGYAAHIVAIHDKYLVNQPSVVENISNIPILRIKSSLENQSKKRLIETFKEEYSPEIVSLQFVPFAFQNRGLPLNLLTLMKVFSTMRWQIMFHELWVGMEINDSIKLKIWGKLQYWIIKKLISSLKPIVIHTSNPTYLNCLKSITKLPIKELPIFSNIKKTSSRDFNVVSSANLKFVIFAGIHEGAPVNQFSEWLLSQSNEHNFKPTIIFVGKNGTHLSEWVKALSYHEIHHEILGIQDAGFISNLLSGCDVGISTTPYFLSGKSGSLAAMLEHDLPVLNVARNWTPNVEASKAELAPTFVLQWHQELNINHLLRRKAAAFSLDEVTRRFLADLQI